MLHYTQDHSETEAGRTHARIREITKGEKSASELDSRILSDVVYRDVEIGGDKKEKRERIWGFLEFSDRKKRVRVRVKRESHHSSESYSLS